MTSSGRSWLVMGGALSGYTFDLFDSVASVGNLDVRFLYTPLDGLPTFDHEKTDGRAVSRLFWTDSNWLRIRRFVRDPRPDAAFAYGTQPCLGMGLAIAQLPPKVPLYYAADTNVAGLASPPLRSLGRHLLYTSIAGRATAALSLGLTNRIALQTLGFRRIIELPVYAVDYAALDTAAEANEASKPTKADKEIEALIIARLTPAKNLPGFVSALAQDADLSARIRLVIAGEGPDRGALEAIKEQVPTLKMELLGPVDRRGVGMLLRRADVLLLPSSVEPWGIVVVEALGMGVPVVATPAVGAAVSLAGCTGAVLISEDAEPHSFVAALRRYLSPTARVAAAAREGASFIRARYGRGAVAKRLLSLVYGDRAECAPPSITG